MATSAHRPHIKCDPGLVGLIEPFVSCGQRQSLIKKDTTALHFPISCERPDWKRVESTAILRARKSLRETPSTTPGKLQWMRASTEQKRSRIRLIVSNRSSETFATGVQGWYREAARC